ncbi:MAG: 3-methyl-2-oxobutanoate hydroxymethyltransferase [Actinobacteria bacterium HGW-Actinobacteria-5]|jgi:3-methyl-2-oxobutanoate hydroxymethyltransferase|nr:MAG: 3-methyl-2-oxobutanoate hydroxymethyltransferase [Actinobacteria bacterium HGW-Actinobacteria-5]
MSSGHGTQPQRVTLSSLARQKAAGEPVVMVTAYDFPSARIADEVGVDLVLVGDSAANVVLGYESTVPVTVEELLVLTRAVRRGLRHPLLVADLPFGSYEASDLDAVHTAQRFVKEGGAEAVKLERGGSIVDRARAIVRAGIPVVGHVGLTPQAATAMGGYRAQGRTAEQAAQLIRDALELESAGCFAIVVEAVPAEVTALLAARLDCLTIGIGAGAATDGQVLVWHDLLGITEGHLARFVRSFADLRSGMVEGLTAYAGAVRAREFPQPEHTYPIEATELDDLRARLGVAGDRH